MKQGCKIEIKKKAYRIVLENDTGCIRKMYDTNDSAPVNLVDENGLFCSVCMTGDKDEFRRMEPNPFIPGNERLIINSDSVVHELIRKETDVLVFENRERGSRLRYDFSENVFTVTGEIEGNSGEYGLNMDFNFLGKNQSNYYGQILPTSPYLSADKKSCYYLMTRPNGKWVLVAATTQAAGWVLRYSDYNYGHFILGLKILGSFDRAFQKERGPQKISLSVCFPRSYEDALIKISRILNAPVPYIHISGACIGSELPVSIIGECHSARVLTPSGAFEKLEICRQDGSQFASVSLIEPGFYRVEAFGENGRAMDCTLFAFPGWRELFYKSSLKIHAPYHIDENLAEGGAWCWALCEYLARYPETDDFKSLGLEFLEQKVMAVDNPVPRCTIVPYPHEFDGIVYEAYHIYKSGRIQEQFFGVSILLAAYKAFNNKKYLEYASKTMENLVRQHINPDGRIICFERNKTVDYTTVCAPVIAAADIANVLLERSDVRGARFREVAIRIADYLVKRGFDFPTECDQEYAKREMEDGSISCTALSVLYVCYHIEFKQEYIDFARKVLELHDAWLIYTPDVRMYHSSFRWWETIWEGDQNGPCINAGHAWTIWRGEADYYYALLTGSFDRLKDSYNAFMTNLCKIEKDGIMRACYVPDFIPFGAEPGRIVRGYPHNEDRSLSRYLWARAVGSWYKTSGIGLNDGMIVPVNGSVKKNGEWVEFRSTAEDFQIMLLGPWVGKLRIYCDNTISLIHTGNLEVHTDYFVKKEKIVFHLMPHNGRIDIES